MAGSYIWHDGLWMMIANLIIWMLAFGALIYMIGRGRPYWEEVPPGLDYRESIREVARKRYEDGDISQQEYEDILRRTESPQA